MESFIRQLIDMALVKGKSCKLAVVLTEKVYATSSIDWILREGVQTQLRVIIKRTLRKYGYPFDMQQLVTETVMKQTGMIAEDLVG